MHAHNRWLVDWCGEFPERRAGVGQIFLNDVDDAIEDVHWIKEHGLRGGILLPNIAARREVGEAALRPGATTGCGRCCQDLEIPVNVHSGTGNPDYGPYPTSMLLYINEVIFYTQRPFVQLTLSGVFERFPRLKFVMTEAGCAWVPPLLAQLDHVIEGVRDTGATGEIRYSADQALSKTRHGVLPPERVDGREPARAPPTSRPATRSASTGSCGAATTPTTRARHPYTREHLRARFSDVDPSRGAHDAERERGQALRLRPGRPRARWPSGSDRRVAEVATPIDEVPDKKLERISGDMDTRAIK